MEVLPTLTSSGTGSKVPQQQKPPGAPHALFMPEFRPLHFMKLQESQNKQACTWEASRGMRYPKGQAQRGRQTAKAPGGPLGALMGRGAPAL